jgi:UDP-N-acetylglucosamine pyrophosphorylase
MHDMSEAPGTPAFTQLPAALRADMERKNIDIPLSLEVLQGLNKSLEAGAKNPGIRALPALDDPRIVHLGNNDRSGGAPLLAVNFEDAAARLASFGLKLPEGLSRVKSRSSKQLAAFTRGQLSALGKAILPYTAYGVLNGGSATSYADAKKNLSLGGAVFTAVKEPFERLASGCRGRPKGSAPAFINPDGSPGPSFLELKMRQRLLAVKKSRRQERKTLFSPGMTGEKAYQTPRLEESIPLYQMTSPATQESLEADYRRAEASDYLRRLASSLDIEPAKWESGVQPLICAYTHSSEGQPRRIFDRAFGSENASLPLPGGHGQCFKVLKDVFVRLRSRGFRYAYLGNVDNLGYTIDTVELGVLALTGSPAGFEFARRSSLDLKGGVLAEDDRGRWTVADIGPAISFETLKDLEKGVESSLFNCATGIFDLEYLVPRIDDIARRLPLRVSDQDKDAGRYSQVEQVTWEVMGLLPDFIVFSVRKSERFLAAKLLIDTLLTSGLGLDNPLVPENVRKTAADLHEGLERLLRRTYELELSDGRWLPKELL